MSFSIRHIIRLEIELITFTDDTTVTEAAVLPGFGATLQAFHIRQKGRLTLQCHRFLQGRRGA